MLVIYKKYLRTLYVTLPWKCNTVTEVLWLARSLSWPFIQRSGEESCFKVYQVLEWDQHCLPAVWVPGKKFIKGEVRRTALLTRKKENIVLRSSAVWWLAHSLIVLELYPKLRAPCCANSNITSSYRNNNSSIGDSNSNSKSEAFYPEYFRKRSVTVMYRRVFWARQSVQPVTHRQIWSVPELWGSKAVWPTMLCFWCCLWWLIQWSHSSSALLLAWLLTLQTSLFRDTLLANTLPVHQWQKDKRWKEEHQGELICWTEGRSSEHA